MIKEELKKWIESKFLEWQTIHGRSTVTKFAEFLGVGRAYLTMIMNGDRTKISYPTALMISQRLDDYTLLDLLEYARPQEDTLLNRYKTLIQTDPEMMNHLEELARLTAGNPNTRKQFLNIIAELAIKMAEQEKKSNT